MSSVDQAYEQPEDLARSTYESLVNSLPLCILIKAPDGKRLFANEAYLRFRNISLEQLVGKVDGDLFPHEIANRFTEADQRVLNGETLQSVQQTIDANGNHVWMERVKSPIRKSDGQVVGVQIVFWDVTKRIEAQEQMKFERHLLDALLNNLPDSIYFKDTESKFIRISNAMASKFGFQDVKDVVGKTDADVFSNEHADAARNDELEIIRSGESLVDRIEKETWPNRDDSWCMSTKMPFRDHKGAIIGTFGISRDITDLVKSQESLQTARDSADKANRAKSEFLANMSHEIRTPMNAIIGMSELLSQTQLTQEQNDYVELVRESSTNLLRLLNDILDFSRIEARRLEIETTPFDVRDLVEKATRTVSIRAAEKDLELTCRVSPDVPAMAVGDPGRIRQVLINLVSNGIKFTGAGQVSINVHRVPTDISGQCSLCFEVKDTGIGIAADKQAAVMEPFTQADASTTRRFGGTGLGLTISRELVELMGGSISLESQIDVGTTFSFTLPLGIASNESQTNTRDLAGMQVLVVDDNSTNRKILTEILTAWNCVPVVAESGPQAMQRIQEGSNSVSLVLLDYMMPEMDGYEVAKRLRAIYPRDSLKMIVLSSAAHHEVAEKFSELGIDRYMTKPVVQSELLETVLNVMEISPAVAAEPPTTSELASYPLNVLVAEDGLANQHVANGLLKFAGHQCTIAVDGIETIEKWKNGNFDLILMDMHMPEMDGLEAAKRIREIEQATNKERIPIVALTAAAMKEDAEACIAAGMDDYLCKPISKDALQAKLRSFMDPNKAPTGSPTTSQKAEPEANVIDVQAACKNVAGGMRGLAKLAPVFLKECQDLSTRIDASLIDGNFKELGRAAHTLRGCANLFSAQRLASLSSAVEESAKGELKDQLPDQVCDLKTELSKVIAAVATLAD